jgi:hypothetical protein
MDSRPLNMNVNVQLSGVRKRGEAWRPGAASPLPFVPSNDTGLLQRIDRCVAAHTNTLASCGFAPATGIRG